MATMEECEAAMQSWGPAESPAPTARGKLIDRSLSLPAERSRGSVRRPAARWRDPGRASGRPTSGRPNPLTMTSDDLVALTDGQLNFAKAWAAGR